MIRQTGTHRGWCSANISSPKKQPSARAKALADAMAACDIHVEPVVDPPPRGRVHVSRAVCCIYRRGAAANSRFWSDDYKEHVLDAVEEVANVAARTA